MPFDRDWEGNLIFYQDEVHFSLSGYELREGARRQGKSINPHSISFDQLVKRRRYKAALDHAEALSVFDYIDQWNELGLLSTRQLRALMRHALSNYWHGHFMKDVIIRLLRQTGFISDVPNPKPFWLCLDDEEILLFRGSIGAYPHEMCWSFYPDVAIWYADNYQYFQYGRQRGQKAPMNSQGEPHIYKARLKKEDVLAFLALSREETAIVDPADVIDIEDISENVGDWDA